MKKFLAILYLTAFFVGGSIALNKVSHGEIVQAAPYALVALVGVVAPGINSFSSVLGLKNIVAVSDEHGSTTYMTHLQNYLRSYLLSSANDQTRAKIAAGGIAFDPITYYIRYVITGLSGKQKILSETTQKLVGATNFNLGQLPKFTNFAWNKIGIAYVDEATGAVAAQALTGWTNVRGSTDFSVANGEIIVTSSNRTILETPIAPFLREAANTNNTICEGDYELDQFRLFKENEIVYVELNMGGNTVPSVAGHTYGIEVRFSGVQARLV